MSSTARWRNWKPPLPPLQGVESPSKPSKPSEPPVDAPGSEVVAGKLDETVVLVESGATATSSIAPAALAEVMNEVAAFARLGAGAGPAEAPPGGFVGFDGFEAQGNRKNVVEARLHPSGFLVFRPVMGRYPEPRGFRTVVAGYGKDQVRYTAARHQITGTNQIGQSSVEFPFCLVNLGPWRRSPFDLRLVEWYRTEQDAIAKYAPKPVSPPAPEPSACIATFAGGVQIELRRESPSRWEMSEIRHGRRKRRTDFASPCLDHAKRTAIYWYGEPQGDWQEVKDKISALTLYGWIAEFKRLKKVNAEIMKGKGKIVLLKQRQ